MSINKELKKTFSDKEKLHKLRFAWAKLSMMFFSLLFFWNYYLMSFSYSESITSRLLPIFYLAFVLSVTLFFYLVVSKYLKFLILKIIYMIILIVVFLFFVTPFFFPNADFSVIDVSKLPF